MRKAMTVLLLVIFAVPVSLCAQETSQKGTVKIDSPTSEVMVRAGQVVYTLKPGSETQLEPGTYVPVALRIVKPGKVEEGSREKAPLWVLAGKAPWGKLDGLTVEADKTVSLSPGEPVAVKVNTQAAGRDASIGFEFIGNVGESYSPVISCDGKQMPAPSIKILDEKGNVLASGSFSYG